jgi:hypothetical protein
MSLDPYALTSVARAKNYLHLTNEKLQVQALSLYNNSGDATSATVEITATQMILIVTAGVHAGTSTITLTAAANDTLGELVTVINALATGWQAVLIGPSAALSVDLTEIGATEALGIANQQTLMAVDNYLIERLIDAVSGKVEAFCDRQFLTRAYSEWRDGTGNDRMCLPQYPVTAVSHLSVGTRGAMHLKNVSTAATYAAVKVTSSEVTLTLTAAGGVGLDSITFALNPTVGDVVTAINALGSDWQAIVVSAYSHIISTELRETESLNCLNRLVTLEVPDEPASEFEVYADEGILYYPTGFGAGPRRVRVKYVAGYTTVPYALEDIVLSLIAIHYNKTIRDGSLKSESLDSYSWTAADIEIPDEIAKRLWTWRRVSF